MERRIQYAQTEDGVSIAFCVMGDGPPLVYMRSQPFEHIQQEWSLPGSRLLQEPLAQTRRLILFDGRGSGLSQRDVADYSLDARLLDLETVVEHLDLQKLDLIGILGSGAVAIAYAARHPERLSHLILWDTFARGADFLDTPQMQGLLALMEKDWELYTETLGQLLYAWSGEPARQIAAFLRDCVTPEVAKAAQDAQRLTDVTALLPQVTTPTLVLQQTGVAFTSIDMARGLASSIPNARLAVLEGDYTMDEAVQLSTIEEFLGEGEAAAPKAELPEGMAVILFADIVESTALTERLGDAAFRDKARTLDEELRTIIRDANGTPVEGKLLGDGVLSVFSSAKNAIEAAMGFGKAAESVGLGLHVGIHAGDVIREGDNVFGGAVNVAARISGESVGGEVLVSQTVRELARTSAGVSFEDGGERELKGVGEPVRVWRVVEA